MNQLERNKKFGDLALQRLRDDFSIYRPKVNAEYCPMCDGKPDLILCRTGRQCTKCHGTGKA